MATARLLRAGQPAAADLGEGIALEQSPDGTTVLVETDDQDGFFRLRLLPTGAGAPRDLPGQWISSDTTVLLGGGKVLVRGRLKGEPEARLYILNPGAGAPERLDWQAARLAGPLGPDGRTVFSCATAPPDPAEIASWSRPDLTSGTTTPLPEACTGWPVGWTPGGDRVWLLRMPSKDRSFPMEIWRCDLKTGRPEKVREVQGPEYPLGSVRVFRITPDGRSYAYQHGYTLPVRTDLVRLSGVL